MTGRASDTLLDALHGLLVNTQLEELDRAIARARTHPDDPAYAVPPQMIAQAIKTLQMTETTAPKTSPRLDALAQKLADLDLDAEALGPRQ